VALAKSSASSDWWASGSRRWASKPAEIKKLTAGQLFAYLDTFNHRLGAETKVAPHQVANRTVAAHVRESVVTYGLWPQDSAAGVEKMSPFGTLTGAFNGTDVSALEFNLSTGKVEDISRDPKPSAVTGTKEYLTRLRLLVTTIAVFVERPLATVTKVTMVPANIVRC
jgi:hypothetical protein